MADHEASPRAFYDHDADEPRPARRRRPVADWGVGDEVFDHMPRRRFERRPAHQPAVPGGVDDGRPTLHIGDDDALPSLDEQGAPDPDEAAFASREEALRAREEHDAVWGGDEPFADAAVPPDADADTARANADTARDDADAADCGDTGRGPDLRAASVPLAAPDGFAALEDRYGAPATDRSPRGAQQDGRRTVRIGGRPGEFAAPARRRPSRTIDQRIGARPDRVAAWAFALGILLILIAVLV